MFVEGKINGRMQGNATRDFMALEGLADLKDCVSILYRRTGPRG